MPHHRWNSVFMKKIPLLFIVFLPTFVTAQILFQDDFNGTSLDTTEWFERPRPVNAPIGRTQTGSSPVIADGIARLQFDTYNPNAPGRLFSGTELLSLTKYSLDTPGIQGLEFETRMRIGTPLPNGLVVGFFTFGRDGFTSAGDGGTGGFDEIDIEIVSNLINNPTTPSRTQEILFNTFDGQTGGDTIELGPNLIDISALNLSEFNTYKIRWLPDKIQWFINDQKLFTLTESEGAADLANSEQGIHLNLWAPGSSFGLAYDSGLTPTTDPGLNENFFIESDYIRVTAIPEPEIFGFYFGSITMLGVFLKRLFGKRK